MAFLTPFSFRSNIATGGGANPVTSGLVFDLDARYKTYNDGGSTLATNGQTLQEWTTNAGGTYTFAQTTAVDKPEWYSSGAAFNNKPYVSFSGAADSLTTYMLAPYSVDFELQDQTIFLVARNTDSISNGSFDHFFMFGAGVDEGYKMYLDGSTGSGVEYTAGDWNTDFVNGTQTSEQSYIYQMRFEQSTALNLRLDNLTQATDTPAASISYTVTGPPFPVYGFVIGAGYSSGSISRELSCEITRLIIYNRYLDDTERDDVMNYLNDLYATH